VKIKITVDDLEVGQSVTITADGVQYYDMDDDPPGEEIPEEQKESKVRAILGKRTGTDGA